MREIPFLAMSRVEHGNMFLRKKGKEIKETWMKVKLVERKKNAESRNFEWKHTKRQISLL